VVGRHKRSPPHLPVQAPAGSLTAPRGCSSMAEPQPSKLVMRVRSPSPALTEHLVRSGCPVPNTNPRSYPARDLQGRSIPQLLANYGSDVEYGDFELLHSALFATEGLFRLHAAAW